MASEQAATAIAAVNTLDATLLATQESLQTANDNLDAAAVLHSQDLQRISDLTTQLQQLQPQPLPKLMCVTGIERMKIGKPGWQFYTDNAAKPLGDVGWSPMPDGYTDFAYRPRVDWGNCYCTFDGFGPRNDATQFRWQGAFMFASSVDYNGCQAPEFEIEQCINGTTFDTCAIQFPLGGGKPFSKFVRYFDKVKKWRDTTVPFDPALLSGSKLVTVACQCHVDHKAQLVFYDELVLNGMRFDLSALAPCKPGVQQWAATVNYLHFSFQVDPVKSAPVTTRLRDFSIVVL